LRKVVSEEGLVLESLAIMLIFILGVEGLFILYVEPL
jgi:hypothetical protein